MILHRTINRKISGKCVGLVLAAWILFPVIAAAQTWSWTSEVIDVAGTDSAVVVDQSQNIHVSYHYPAGGQLRYAFRPAEGSHWFTMTVDQQLGDFLTRIAVDREENPYICYTPGILKIAHFDGHAWSVQPIDPGGGLVSYYCSIAIGTDQKPQVSWYVESLIRLRHAILDDGVWVAQNVDTQDGSGKINSMVLDSSGHAHLAYIALLGTKLKYAYFDGNQWIRSILDAPDKNPVGGDRGMGNSIALDKGGHPMISYFDTQSLKFTHFINGQWKSETIDQFPQVLPWNWRNFRSAIAVDQEDRIHIVYESLLGLKHAWWDGTQWKRQVLLPATGASLDGGLSIDLKGNLYYSYTDPADHSFKLAIGRYVSSASIETTKADKQDSRKN